MIAPELEYPGADLKPAKPTFSPEKVNLAENNLL
jgi:hypothetical protein